jgi:hypothetical protein
MDVGTAEVAMVGRDRNVFLMTWLRLGEIDWWSMENQTEVERGMAV